MLQCYMKLQGSDVFIAITALFAIGLFILAVYPFHSTEKTPSLILEEKQPQIISYLGGEYKIVEKEPLVPLYYNIDNPNIIFIEDKEGNFKEVNGDIPN